MVENHPADSRVRITDDGKSQTLDARMGMGGGNTPLVMEAEGADETVIMKRHFSDITCDVDKCPTLESAMGMGGNNIPMVTESAGFSYEESALVGSPKTLKIRSGKDGGGKCALVQENQSATLGCNNDQTLFVPFVKTSRAKTSEEISTFEQKEVANILNTFDIGETRCNEMVVALEGNGARPSHKGNGYSEDDKSFTLNTIEQHAVAYDSEKVYSMTCGEYPQCSEEKANCLLSRDFKDPQIINDKKPIGFYPQLKAESVTPLEDKQPCLINGTNPGFQNGVMQAEIIGVDGYNQCSTGDKAKSLRTSQNVDAVPCVMNTNYIVRRLTPTECARLQGFPDWWAHDLGTKHATQEEVAFWQEVWNTWNEINGAQQKKESAVKAWLRDPYSDAAEYKMWGNGVALPCVTFVLAGIEWADRTNQEGKAPVYDRQLSIFDF